MSQAISGIAASPSVVRTVSDFPKGSDSFLGAAPRWLPEAVAPLNNRRFPEGQRPSAHQGGTAGLLSAKHIQAFNTTLESGTRPRNMLIPQLASTQQDIDR
jgi:hypothetical protein